MSNHLTDAQYAAFIDRLVACRQAEDDAKEDTKRVYAELADAGEDKTVAGLIVREQRMSEKDRLKANVREHALDEASERYRRGKASHVRAREAGVETDADGVVTNDEEISTKDPASKAVEAVIATKEISEPPMSNTSGQPGGVDPERKDDAASSGETATVYPGGENANSVGNADASHASLRSGGAEAARLAHNQEVAGASPAPATISEPDAALRPQTAGSETAVDQSHAGDGNARPMHAQTARPDQPVGGASAEQAPVESSAPIEPAAPLAAVAADGDSVADPAAVTVAPAKNDYSRPNPICADPDECGVHGSWNFTCGTCLRRADARRHEASAVH